MSNPTDLNALFGTAQNDGLISAAGMQALTGIQDLGAQINAGLGSPADQFAASESLLVILLIDDSGSIASSGNIQSVITGHNGVIDDLLASKEADKVLFYSRLLSGTLINDFRPLAQAVRLDSQNYQPNGLTPLFRESAIVLASALKKTDDFNQAGIPSRSVTLIVTDGADNASGRVTAQDCKALVGDLLRTEMHLVLALGIGSTPHEEALFQLTFEDMGIKPESILTTKNTPAEVRRGFAVASQSVVRASQNAAQFSQVAAGGFGR